MDTYLKYTVWLISTSFIAHQFAIAVVPTPFIPSQQYRKPQTTRRCLHPVLSTLQSSSSSFFSPLISALSLNCLPDRPFPLSSSPVHFVHITHTLFTCCADNHSYYPSCFPTFLLPLPTSLSTFTPRSISKHLCLF